MTVMRWFRKNNKKMLVGLCVVMMVVFLLPFGAARLGRGGQGNPVWAVVTEDGQEHDIRQSEREQAYRELQLLRLLDMPGMSQALLPCRLWSQLGPVGPIPVRAVHALLFGNMRFNLALRVHLQQRAYQWAADKDQLEALLADIDSVTAAEPADAVRNYLLLAREAQRAGVRPTRTQIQALLAGRRELMQQGELPQRSVGLILDKTNSTEAQLHHAVGNYLAILRYGHMLSKGLILSEPQLRHAVRETVELNNVSGDFVSFPADTFRSRISEPDEQELQDQFEAFKQYEPGDSTEANPHGFGYMLGDRVKVEYLQIDLAPVEQAVAEEFGSLTLADQEKKARDYFSTHRARFRRQGPTERSEDGSAMPEPTFTNEVAEQAREFWKQDEARRRAGQKLADAKSLSQQTQATTDQTDQDTAPADYAALAEQFSTAQAPIAYGQTLYLSMFQMAEYKDFGMTYQLRNDRPEQALITMLFDSAPLSSQTSDRLGTAPIELNEDVGPLVAFDPSGRAQGVYLIRIVGADRKRQAISLADDGRAGLASAQPIGDGTNKLRELVTEDVKTHKSLALAEQWANRFAGQAESDWQTALSEANRALSEPNEPVLVEDSLDSLRDRMRQLQEVIEQQRMPLSGAQAYLAGGMRLIRRAMELAQQRAASGATGPAVLVDEQGGRCVAFKDLQVTTASTPEYLQRRPLTAVQLLDRNQPAMALVHFNPSNIEKRSGWRLKIFAEDRD